MKKVGGDFMTKKILLLLLAFMIALSFVSCGSNNKKAFSTDALKKFVQESKKKGNMDYNKTKKAYKSVFPNMKMK